MAPGFPGFLFYSVGEYYFSAVVLETLNMVENNYIFFYYNCVRKVRIMVFC